MAAEGTAAELKAQVGRPHLELQLADGGAGRAQEVLARFGDLMPSRNSSLMVSLEHGASDIAGIVRALDDAGLYVESLKLVEPTLDDVFVEKTGKHLEGAEQQKAAQEAVPPGQ